MDAKLSNNLRDLNATKDDICIIDRLMDTYKLIIQDEIEGLYFMKDTDETNYFSLFLFANKYQVIIKNYGDRHSVDIYALKKRLDKISIVSNNYDFHKWSSESALVVEYSIGLSDEIYLKAFGHQCKYLQQIVDQFLRPNLDFYDD
jgi:hypothetical protein